MSGWAWMTRRVGWLVVSTVYALLIVDSYLPAYSIVWR